MKTIYFTIICLFSFTFSSFSQIESDDSYFSKKDRLALIESQKKDKLKAEAALNFTSSTNSNQVFYEEKQSIKYRRQNVASVSFINMYQPNCRLGFGSSFNDPFSPWYNPSMNSLYYNPMSYGYSNMWSGQNCYFASNGFNIGYNNRYNSIFSLRNTGYYNSPNNYYANVQKTRAYDARDAYTGNRNGTSANTVKSSSAYSRSQNFLKSSMMEGGKMININNTMSNSRGGSSGFSPSFSTGGSNSGGGRSISSGGSSGGGGGRSTSSGSGGGGRR